YAAMGPTFGLIENLAPPNMRSQAVAIMLFTANVANLVIAPQLIGIASDALARSHGAESLRIALIPLAFTGFWAALHYGLCARHLARDMRTAGIEPTADEASFEGAAPLDQSGAR